MNLGARVPDTPASPLTESDDVTYLSVPQFLHMSIWDQ